VTISESVLSIWHWVKRHVLLLLLLVAVVVVCVLNQKAGHNWGDDFTLYIRQSQALVEGNVGEVLAMNRYTSMESSWTFGPLAVPWGTPILLSPVIALFGIDYAKLKLLETLFFAGFLLFFYKLVERRTGQIGALALVAFIGFNFAYVFLTDNVLSECPYLLFVGLTLWWLDRCRDRQVWEAGSWGPLIVAGVLIGFTYSIRREGIVLVIVLLVAQVVHLWRRRRKAGAADPSPIPWRRLATPYASAAAFVLGLQVLIPGVLLHSSDEISDGIGFHQLWRNIKTFVRVLAEHLGMNDPGPQPWEFLGSTLAAQMLVFALVLFAVIGIISRLLWHSEDDALLVAFMVCSAFVIWLVPRQGSRDFLSITPFLVYFAFQGIALIGRELIGPHADRWARLAPSLVAVAFISVFTMANVTDLQQSTWYGINYGHFTQEGPEGLRSQEMFEAVQTFTRRDEVIGFGKARAMNLYTDRQSVGLLTIEEVLAKADWFVMVKDNAFLGLLLLTPEQADAAGLQLVWENNRFVLWKVPSR